mmetsp:Transcript_749/g.941  ORF Transcript_749/g.941 Transcript_749/m.941 type:complete len:225 (-) Transcript_749:304-978(-)
MHRGDREVGVAHLCREPVDLQLGIAEDDSLRDGECIIEVTQSVELPLFFLNSNEELLDALECQLVTLHQDTNRFVHEFSCHLKDLLWESRRYQDNLHFWRKVPVDVIELLLEALAKHLVGLVNHEHFQVFGFEATALNHVVHATRSTRHHMNTSLEGSHVLSNTFPADAGVHTGLHVVSKGHHHFTALLCQFTCWRKYECLEVFSPLVNRLEDTHAEDGCLSST